MKEFIFEDKTENIVDLVGFSPIEECFIVINAELGTTYPAGSAMSSRPKLASPSNGSLARDNFLKEAFMKGVQKAL
ncbi:MAG: hypothetical protein NT178_18775 [Proteobacteria bacterium]|nr:hypothetical protein [Pseudomonadota bacterium]